MDCVCFNILNRGLYHGLLLSLFKLIPAPYIELFEYVLTYLDFIIEF